MTTPGAGRLGRPEKRPHPLPVFSFGDFASIAWYQPKAHQLKAKQRKLRGSAVSQAERIREAETDQKELGQQKRAYHLTTQQRIRRRPIDLHGEYNGKPRLPKAAAQPVASRKELHGSIVLSLLRSCPLFSKPKQMHAAELRESVSPSTPNRRCASGRTIQCQQGAGDSESLTRTPLFGISPATPIPSLRVYSYAIARKNANWTNMTDSIRAPMKNAPRRSE